MSIINPKVIAIVLIVILIAIIGGITYYIYKSDLSAADSSADSISTPANCPIINNTLCSLGQHKISGKFLDGNFKGCNYEKCLSN